MRTAPAVCAEASVSLQNVHNESLLQCCPFKRHTRDYAAVRTGSGAMPGVYATHGMAAVPCTNVAIRSTSRLIVMARVRSLFTPTARVRPVSGQHTLGTQRQDSCAACNVTAVAGIDGQWASKPSPRKRPAGAGSKLQQWLARCDADTSLRPGEAGWVARVSAPLTNPKRDHAKASSR